MRNPTCLPRDGKRCSVLYDGPLKIPRILLRVNAQEKQGSVAKKGHSISESALRKRLDVLIGRGIIARAGNERTNPYYFIRRLWIFNRYILARCRENPAGGLLDLKILLGEISRHAPEGKPEVVQPRVISAIGERTERSHEVKAAYEAFRRVSGSRKRSGIISKGSMRISLKGRSPQAISTVRLHGIFSGLLPPRPRKSTRSVLLLVCAVLPDPRPVPGVGGDV